MPKKEPGYAKAMEELEAIIEEIESESIDVDVLTEKVKRASFLIGLCRGKLKDTEGEVRKVLDGLEQEHEEEDEAEEEDGSEGDGALF
jgi:exodeoxyribonuclease VII small subunit